MEPVQGVKHEMPALARLHDAIHTYALKRE
jgi:hypothetical protein